MLVIRITVSMVSKFISVTVDFSYENKMWYVANDTVQIKWIYAIIGNRAIFINDNSPDLPHNRFIQL